MIDERHEELAALYALDLLEGAERTSFESALASDPALQALVRELRETGASLAHTAPGATPPAALRARLLSTISALPPRASAPADNVIRPPASLFRTVLPWTVAACFALSAAWLGQLYITARSQADLLRDTQRLTEITLQSAQQQHEAERILTTRKILNTEKSAADATQALADARAQLTQRDTQLASLNQRIESLASTSTDLTRRLAESQQRIAALTEQFKRESDLANLKITALASMVKDSPLALGVAVWNPEKQEGVLKLDKLPALAPNEDYQLWVVDSSQYKDPVDGGVFTVGAQNGDGRITFKTKQPIKSVDAFAVTRERKGGVPKAEGPFILLGK